MPLIPSPQPAAGTLDSGPGPSSAVALASVARTATTQVFFTPGDHDALEVLINLTAFAVAASLTPSIEAYDPASDTWETLLTGVAIVANGAQSIRVGGFYTAAANVAAQRALAPQMRITLTHGNANSHTYSVGLRAQ